MSNKKYHYTYYSYEEWGRGYIGCRSCNCLPEQDINYFGSFHDKTFNPTQKVIIETFKTRKDAIRAEIKLHNFYDIALNSHFANRAKQTSTKFTREGAVTSQETKEKMSKVKKGKFFLNESAREKIRRARALQVFTEESSIKRKQTLKKLDLVWMYDPKTKKNHRIMRIKVQEKLSEGLVLGRICNITEETRKKLSDAANKRWSKQTNK
jgi:hypothetical protein